MPERSRLLAADTSFGTSAFDSTSPYSNAYRESTVKSKLDALTAEGGAFAGVKDAIVDTNLSDVDVTGAKLYLLSTDEAVNVFQDVLKFLISFCLIFFHLIQFLQIMKYLL